MNLATLMGVLADANKVRKAVHLAVLLPTMIPTVTAVHAAVDGTPEERRNAVLTAVNKITDLLEAAGHIPAEMNKGIDRTAEDLYDVIVAGLTHGGVVR